MTDKTKGSEVSLSGKEAEKLLSFIQEALKAKSSDDPCRFLIDQSVIGSIVVTHVTDAESNKTLNITDYEPLKGSYDA